MSMKNFLQNIVVRYFGIISSVWFKNFSSLFHESKQFSKFNWLSTNIFSVRITFINFCRRCYLTIRNKLKICICNMLIMLFETQAVDFEVRKRSLLYEYYCEARVKCFSKVLSISRWSKTFDKNGYRWAAVVEMQSRSICAESVERTHSSGVIRGLSGKLFGVSEKFCFRGS